MLALRLACFRFLGLLLGGTGPRTLPCACLLPQTELQRGAGGVVPRGLFLSTLYTSEKLFANRAKQASNANRGCVQRFQRFRPMRARVQRRSTLGWRRGGPCFLGKKRLHSRVYTYTSRFSLCSSASSLRGTPVFAQATRRGGCKVRQTLSTALWLRVQV